MFSPRTAAVFLKLPPRLRTIRCKHKENHWSVKRKQKSSREQALEHFDDFYGSIFKKQWDSIRHGLLNKKQKYMALINNYSDAEETMKGLENIGAINVRVLFNLERERILEELAGDQKSKLLNRITGSADNVSPAKEDKTLDEQPPNASYSLESSLSNAEIDESRLIDTNSTSAANSLLFEYVPATKIKGMDDYITESSHYKYYDTTQLDVPIVREYELTFPESLNVYTYEMENDTPFDAPRPGSTGVLNYFLLDGGSVLPVLALDVKAGNTILDMCAAPGGKSLIALQTLMPDLKLFCNDVSSERVNRIYKVFKSYLYDLNDRWLSNGAITVTKQDGRFINDGDFDRVIVDVPCTTDRHTVKENDNNIFKSSRIKERLKLPELQSELLMNGLKRLKPGGFLVYSTCTLSPIQNDGVVHMSLKRLCEETDMKFVIRDLSPALIQTRCIYKLADRKLMKYGHLVLPYGPLNFGPTYFCKIQRIH